MGAYDVGIQPHVECPGLAPGFRFRNETILRGFFSGSATSVGLALGGKLAEVFTATLCGHRAAFAAQYPGRWQFLLLEQVIRQGDGSAKQFLASRSVGKCGWSEN